MDKHEYKYFKEEIEYHVSEGKYSEAIDLADSVNWSNVNDIEMLCTISDLYKYAERYEESRDVMSMAYDIHPSDKLIVYSLCDLSIKLKDVIQALNYYNEYVKVSKNDYRCLILQYKLYEAQEVPLEERIEVLENLKSKERIDRWMYELALLYKRIGQKTKCIQECDDIYLWFGKGSFVKKALKLKMSYTDLNEEQKALLEGKNTKRNTNKKKKKKRKSADLSGTDNIIDNNDNVFDSDIVVKPVNVGKFGTINLQRELAENLQEVIGNEDQAGYTQEYNNNAEVESENDRADVSPDFREKHPDEIKGKRVFVKSEIEEWNTENNIQASENTLGSKSLSETEILRNFEADMGSDDDIYNYEEYHDATENPLSGIDLESSDLIEELNEDINEDYHKEYDLYNVKTEENRRFINDELNDKKQGSESNSTVGTVGSYTGNIIDKMLNQSDNSYQSVANKNDNYASSEPRVVKLASTGGIPKININNVVSADNNSDSTLFSDKKPSIRTSSTIINNTDGNLANDNQKIKNRLPSAEKMSQSGDENYNRLLLQQEDGQISMSMIPVKKPEKQLTGQISLEGYLNSWEKKKLENKEREEEEIRNRIKKHTGELFEEFDKTTKENLLTELGALSEDRKTDKKSLNSIQNQVKIKKNVPSDTSVLISQARDIIGGKISPNELPASVVVKGVKETSYNANRSAKIDFQTQNRNLSITTLKADSDNSELNTVQVNEISAAVERVITPQSARNLTAKYENGVDSGEMKEITIDNSNYTDNGDIINGYVSDNDDNDLIDTQDYDNNISSDYQDYTQYKDGQDYAPYEGEDNSEDDTNENLAGQYDDSYESSDPQPSYEVDDGAEYNGYTETDENADYSSNVYYSEDDKNNSTLQDGDEEYARVKQKKKQNNKKRGLSSKEKKLFGTFIQTKSTLNQIINVVDNMSMEPDNGNIIITGEQGMNTCDLAKKIIEVLQDSYPDFSGKIAKISGDSINKKNIEKTFMKLTDGALIIENASLMSFEKAEEIIVSLCNTQSSIIVILEDTKLNISRLLDSNNDIEKIFDLRIDLEALDNDSLVEFGKKYAMDREYSIDELGILALYTRISDLQTSEHSVTTRDVKEIIDKAIKNSEKKTPSHFVDIIMGKRYDDEDMVILREKDFV